MTTDSKGKRNNLDHSSFSTIKEADHCLFFSEEAYSRKKRTEATTERERVSKHSERNREIMRNTTRKKC